MSSSPGSVFTDWRLWMLGIALILAFAIDVNRCQNEKRVRRVNQYEADQRAWEDRQRQERLDRDEELRRKERERREIAPSAKPGKYEERNPNASSSPLSLTVALNPHHLAKDRKEPLIFAYKSFGVPADGEINDFRRVGGWVTSIVPSSQKGVRVPLPQGFTAIMVSGTGILTTYTMVRVDGSGSPSMVTPGSEDRGMIPKQFSNDVLEVSSHAQSANWEVMLRGVSALRGWLLEFPVIHWGQVRLHSDSFPGVLASKAGLSLDIVQWSPHKVLPEILRVRQNVGTSSLSECIFAAPVGSDVDLHLSFPEEQFRGLEETFLSRQIREATSLHTLELDFLDRSQRSFSLIDCRGQPVPSCAAFSLLPGLKELKLFTTGDGVFHVLVAEKSPLSGTSFEVRAAGHTARVIRWAHLPKDGTPLNVQLNRLTECIRIEIDYPIGATDRDRVRVNARVWDEELAQPRVISELLPESGEHEIPTKLPAKAEVTVTSDRHIFENQSEGWDPDHKCRWFRYHARPLLSAHLMLGSRPLGAQWPSDTPIHVTISQWFPGGVFSSSVKDPTLAIWAKQPTEFLLSNPPYIPVTQGNWEVTVGAIHTDGLIHGWKRFDITDTQQPVTDVTIDNTNFSPWRSFKIKDETGRFTAAKAEFFWPQRGMGSVAEAAQWCSFKQDTLGRTATTPEIGRTLTPNRSAWVMTSHSPEYVVLPSGFRKVWWCLPTDRSGVYQANIDDDAHTITITRPSTHTSVDFQLPVSEKDLKPVLTEDQLAQVPTWTVAIWPAWYSGTATGRPVLEVPFSEFHYASIRSLPAGDYLARVSMPASETANDRQWTEPTPFSIGSSDTVVVPIASLKVASVVDWPK